MGTQTGDCNLSLLLQFACGFSKTFIDNEAFTFNVTRIAGSRLTFIKKDFVESYDIEPLSRLDQTSTVATITLKNGTVFSQLVVPDYPY